MREQFRREPCKWRLPRYFWHGIFRHTETRVYLCICHAQFHKPRHHMQNVFPSWLRLRWVWYETNITNHLRHFHAYLIDGKMLHLYYNFTEIYFFMTMWWYALVIKIPKGAKPFSKLIQHCVTWCLRLTPQERSDASFHRPLEFLFKRLFILTKTKIIKAPRYWSVEQSIAAK